MQVRKIAAVCALAASGVVAGTGVASAAGLTNGLTSAGQVVTGQLGGGGLPLPAAGGLAGGLPGGGLVDGLSVVGR